MVVVVVVVVVGGEKLIEGEKEEEEETKNKECKMFQTNYGIHSVDINIIDHIIGYGIMSLSFVCVVGT